MVNNEKYRTTVFPVDKQCIDGIRAETYLPLKDKGTPTGTISMVCGFWKHTQKSRHCVVFLSGVK